MKKAALIMAGGKGERFWPLSRQDNPKQFMKIVDNRELIALTVERLRHIFEEQAIFFVTTKRLSKRIGRLFPQAGLIAEPSGRNTLAACAVGTFAASSKAYELIGVFPSDHYIKNGQAFANTVNKAFSLAEQGYIVTIGIKPTRPDVGFGYIERDEVLNNFNSAFTVKKFHEKPDRETADKYLKDGNYYWNSGMFFWRADVFKEELKRLQPYIYKTFVKYSNITEHLNEIYSTLPSISVDYGIMEKTRKIAVIEAEFDWEDLGSYTALPRVIKEDVSGNIKKGDAVMLDCRDSIAVSEQGMIAAIGVSDLIIVHTNDVTLIVPKDRAQEIKKLLKKMRDEGKTAYL